MIEVKWLVVSSYQTNLNQIWILLGACDETMEKGYGVEMVVDS